MSNQIPCLKVPADFDDKDNSTSKKTNLKCPSMFTKEHKSQIESTKIVKPSDLLLQKPDIFVQSKSEPSICGHVKEDYESKCFDLENRIKMFEKSEAKMIVDLDECRKKIRSMEADAQFIHSQMTEEKNTLNEKMVILEGKLSNNTSFWKKKVNNVEKENLELLLENKQLVLSLDQMQSKISKLEESKRSKVEEYESLVLELNELKEIVKSVKILSNEKEMLQLEKCDLSNRLDISNEKSSSLLDEVTKLKSIYKSNLVLLQERESTLKSEINQRSLCESSLERSLKEAKLCEEKLLSAQKEYTELMKEKCHLESRIQDVHVTNLSLEDDLLMKSNQLCQLQKSTDALQTTNKQLKIHLDAVLELISLQEKKLSTSQINPTESLVRMWREKVYQLLVIIHLQKSDNF